VFISQPIPVAKGSIRVNHALAGYKQGAYYVADIVCTLLAYSEHIVSTLLAPNQTSDIQHQLAVMLVWGHPSFFTFQDVTASLQTMLWH